MLANPTSLRSDGVRVKFRMEGFNKRVAGIALLKRTPQLILDFSKDDAEALNMAIGTGSVVDERLQVRRNSAGFEGKVWSDHTGVQRPQTPLRAASMAAVTSLGNPRRNTLFGSDRVATLNAVPPSVPLHARAKTVDNRSASDAHATFGKSSSVSFTRFTRLVKPIIDTVSKASMTCCSV